MRIAIAGNSGSGKSTLARALASDESIATLDLDSIAWEPNQIAVPRAVDLAISDVRDFCEAHSQWIVEGCYARLITASLSFEPCLLVLDPGLEQCVSNCHARPWEPHKYASKPEQDSRLPFLLNWIEAYYSRDDDMSLVAHKALYEQYCGPKQWLTRLPDADFTIAAGNSA